MTATSPHLHLSAQFQFLQPNASWSAGRHEHRWVLTLQLHCRKAMCYSSSRIRSSSPREASLPVHTSCFLLFLPFLQWLNVHVAVTANYLSWYTFWSRWVRKWVSCMVLEPLPGTDGAHSDCRRARLRVMMSGQMTCNDIPSTKCWMHRLSAVTGRIPH